MDISMKIDHKDGSSETVAAPAARLALLRKQMGLSQKKLAELSGVNIRQIQRYENGTSSIGSMTLANAVAIAAALGVTPQDLL